MTLPAFAVLAFLAAVPKPPSIATTPAAARLQLATTDAAAATERSGGQLASQIALGTVVGGAFAFAGYWGGAFAGIFACRGFDCVYPGVAIGVGVGMAVGAPLGVLLASSLTGYQGSVGNAFLFAAIAALPPIAMAFLPNISQGPVFVLTVALAAALPIAGAVIGHGFGVPSSSAPLAWMPTFVPRPGGATFAVVGVL